MATRAPTRRLEQSVPLETALASFVRALRAENRSSNTIKSYEAGVRQLAAFLLEGGRPATLLAVTRPLVEEFLASVVQSRSAATAQTRHDSLKAFFAWLVRVEELAVRRNPMIGVNRPHAPAKDVELVSADEARRLLAVCGGRGFRDRRDRAMLLLLWDTGVRVGGLVSMRLDAVDLDEGVATVVLKGGKDHPIFFGAKASTAIDRYLWVRRSHPQAAAERLWVGHRGPLTTSGVEQMLEDRASEAQLGRRVHPHMFRHSHCDQWLSSGGSEETLITHMGWTSGKQLARYGRIRKVERAREAHRKLSPGDRL